MNEQNNRVCDMDIAYMYQTQIKPLSLGSFSIQADSALDWSRLENPTFDAPVQCLVERHVRLDYPFSLEEAIYVGIHYPRELTGRP